MSQMQPCASNAVLMHMQCFMTTQANRRLVMQQGDEAQWHTCIVYEDIQLAAHSLDSILNRALPLIRLQGHSTINKQSCATVCSRCFWAVAAWQVPSLPLESMG